MKNIKNTTKQLTNKLMIELNRFWEFATTIANSVAIYALAMVALQSSGIKQIALASALGILVARIVARLYSLHK